MYLGELVIFWNTFKVSMPLSEFTAPHASVAEKEQGVTSGDHTHFCSASQGCCQLHVLCGNKAVSCTAPDRLNVPTIFTYAVSKVSILPLKDI